MAHSSFMKYSENFAELLTKQFVSSSNLQNGGVKQAGFYVLVGASMPSVLVESGYLQIKKMLLTEIVKRQQKLLNRYSSA